MEGGRRGSLPGRGEVARRLVEVALEPERRGLQLVQAPHVHSPQKGWVALTGVLAQSAELQSLFVRPHLHQLLHLNNGGC